MAIPNIPRMKFPIAKGIHPGFLLKSTNLHATKFSHDEQSLLIDMFVIQNFLTSSANALWGSDVAVLKHDETIILRHTSAFSPDNPESTLVLMAAFLISSPSTSSRTIGCIFRSF